MADPRDYYEVLGVARKATPPEIKKAYRRLAKKHHPDVNPHDKSAEDRFKEVSAAFEVLSDPVKRKIYDEIGHDGAKLGWDPKKVEQYRQYQSAGPGGPLGGGAPFDLGDLFGDLFGGARGGGRTRAPFGFDFGGPGPTAGADLSTTVRITLADAVRGVELPISLERPVSCAACRGRGTAGQERVCGACKGTGGRRRGRGLQSVCEQCRGRGMVSDRCGACGGQGATTQRSRLSVKVPAGIADGGKVRLSGQGAAGQLGGPAGDLYIEVQVEPHALVRRDADDLRVPLPLTVSEAILGATVSLPTFDGPVSLKVPAGAQSGQTLRLRGRGVPHLRGDGRGDLYAEIRVMVPTGPAASGPARELDALYDGDVRKDLAL